MCAAKTLLVLGDSISAGFGLENSEQSWVNLLAQKLSKKDANWQVINASITGDTTSGGLARLPSLLTLHKPQIVLIELGGNDGLRGINLNATKSNLTQMVQLVKNQKAQVILAGMQLPPNYGAAFTAQFAQIYADVAKSHNVTLIPFILEGVGGTLDMMQSDGIHPNDKGQPLILDNVWQVLAKIL